MHFRHSGSIGGAALKVRFRIYLFHYDRVTCINECRRRVQARYEFASSNRTKTIMIIRCHFILASCELLYVIWLCLRPNCQTYGTGARPLIWLTSSL